MTTQGAMKEKLSALMNQRDIELPIAKRKVVEEIEKLRKIHADIERKESEVQEEIAELLRNPSFAGITQSNTSVLVLDLPHVAWRQIERYFEGQESYLLNICLSSPFLDHAITNGSPRNKLRLLGEKVFSVLILRYYVSRADMQNCLNTTCKDLQYFAGSSWWWFRNTLERLVKKKMEFNSRDEIKEFSEKAEQAANKWDFFKNTSLRFSPLLRGTKSEYDEFFEAAISLQKTFRKYITDVEWCNTFPGNQKLYDFCPDLLTNFPRLKYVNWRIDPAESHLILSGLAHRTVESFLTLYGNFYVPQITSVNSSRGSSHGCGIRCLPLKHRIPPVVSTTLEIWMFSIDVIDQYDSVRAADTNFSTVRCLQVTGPSHHFRSIAMLEKFPNVTTLILTGRVITNPLLNEKPAPDVVFPLIKKLTWGICCTAPLTLDNLPRHFPFLRSLTITDNKFSGFKKKMSKWQLEGRFNEGVLDVYRFYAENRSLKESNIWDKMPYLTQLCIETQRILEKSDHLLGEGEGAKEFITRQEIYRRTEGGRILLEITFS